jgi:hypothetical protein
MENVIDRSGLEGKARLLIGEQYGVELRKRRLAVGTKADGSERFHEFDGVSPDCQIVIEIKTNKLDTSIRARGRYDSAIKQALTLDLYMLTRIRAKTKLLVLTDRPLFDLCSLDMDGVLARDTQIVYCSC